MNLKAKVYVENQKKTVQEALNVHLARLKEKGLKEDIIQRDATIRKLKAQLRKADYRLASIAAQEKLNQERAQAKLEKQAAKKAAQEGPPIEAEKGEPGKKEKKAKKEKQGKQEKQAKPGGKEEGKKEKKEKPDKQAKPEGKEEGMKEKKEKPEKPKKGPEKEEDV